MDYATALAGDTAHFAKHTEYDPDNWNVNPFGDSPHQWACNLVYWPVLKRFSDRVKAAYGRPACIVDLGCGTGASSLLLAYEGHYVLGIDACPERIAIARHEANTWRPDVRGSLHYECGDFHNGVPACEAVFSMKTMHHVPDPGRLLRIYVDALPRRGLIGILDQMDGGLFSDTAAALVGGLLPPGSCDAPWAARVRHAAYRCAVVVGARTDEAGERSPLEDIGLTKIRPAFDALFTRYRDEAVDPLRLAFAGACSGVKPAWRWALEALARVQSRLPVRGLERYLEGRKRDVR